MVLVLVTAACGGDGGEQIDLAGGIAQQRADDTMTALCDIAEGRVTAFDEVRARFQNRAHETLHHIAGEAQERDPAAAAALLEAKSLVEEDLEQDEAPAALADHAAALAEATAAAIRVIGLDAGACSA
jgi:hypothetical protein